MMIALSVGLGYLFSTIPNVELVTSTIFLSGYLLGPKSGILIGIIAEGLYSLLNPYGMAPPPMFIAQITAMGIAGWTGGFYASKSRLDSVNHLFYFGLAGLVLTLNFAFLTTLAYAVTIQGSIKAIVLSLIQGIHYYLLHMISNTLLFIFFIPVILRLAGKYHWLSLFEKGSINV